MIFGLVFVLYFLFFLYLKVVYVPLTTADLDLMQSTMLSPFSIHQQQQLTMLGQQQSFVMAASAKSSVGYQRFPAIVYQPWSNGTILMPNQNWGSIGYQVPGMMMPVADQQKYMQV